MGAMDYFRPCSCSSGSSVEDFLMCAPCPPSVLTYPQLKLIAVGRLCQREVCSIARRCRMAETPILTMDCPDSETSLDFKCGLTCITIIACVLVLSLILILIVTVYKRKKGHIKQDIVNVVFNDTDSETSKRSSDRGSDKIASKQGCFSKANTELQHRTGKTNPNVEDIRNAETTAKNADTVTSGNPTSTNGTEQSEQKGYAKQGQTAINGHSSWIAVDVRSKVNTDTTDSCMVAKL